MDGFLAYRTSMARHLDRQPEVLSTTHRRAGWVFPPTGPIALCQYGRYGAGIRCRRRFRGRWDCHTPGPGTGVQAQVLGAFRSTHHYTLQHQPEELRIVDIGSGHYRAQGSASPVDQDAFLPAGPAPVCEVASNSAPPKRAFPIEQSADCHSQFTLSSSRHSSISAARIPSSSPRSTQRWKVRCMCCHPPIPWAIGWLNHSL